MDKGDAQWQPQVDPPLLKPLIERGQLPPITARVGLEPCVVEGVDGLGMHGGTMVVTDSPNGILSPRFSYCTFVRWSPYGEPLVPHLAKAIEISDDQRAFTIYLRKGIRWSDGHPFTADDVLYWWQNEILDYKITPLAPEWLLQNGRLPVCEALDEHCVRFTFAQPNSIFLYQLATPAAEDVSNAPAHYLRSFHPTLGDPEVIHQTMRSRRIARAVELYRDIKKRSNPEHPRLWPWLTKIEQTTPPFSYVRNPYYWQVDSAGRQLPYLDRLISINRSPDMVAGAMVNGELDYAAIHFRNYTLLMSGRLRSDGSQQYEVYRWLRADRSDNTLFVNINRAYERIETAACRLDDALGKRLAEPVIVDDRLLADRDTQVDAAMMKQLRQVGIASLVVIDNVNVDPLQRKKAELLGDRRFRRALSLAIDREKIINAVYFGQTEPAQLSPGAHSPWRHDRSMRAFTEFDPVQAERLLDELGLLRKGQWRTFPDGSAMHWNIDHVSWFGDNTAQFIVDNWNAVGLYTTSRKRDHRQLSILSNAGQCDFFGATGNNEMYPFLGPRGFVPFRVDSCWALGYTRWYQNGGLRGDPRSKMSGCIEPPLDHPAREVLEKFERFKQFPDPAERKRLMDRILDIAAEEAWTISVSISGDYLGTIASGLSNIPKRAAYCWEFASPGNMGTETWYWSDQNRREDNERIRDRMREELQGGIIAPGVLNPRNAHPSQIWGLEICFRWLCIAVVLLITVALALRHPFLGRRLALMVPTLFIISIAVFTIVELPPGDYITTRIAELQQQGGSIPQDEIDKLRSQYGLDRGPAARYLNWIGMEWFWTFESERMGLLQGELGRSMSYDNRPVKDVVGDRILYTLLISLGTVLVTWAFAIPSGIYSAVRQYSPGDYGLTLLGFVGMCLPGFILAILAVFLAKVLFDIQVTGLTSLEYAGVTQWSWGRVLDLLGYIWVPILVLGIGGIGHMLRIMRGNLLDELKQPYVTTARAKGVRPLKLLLKYPVRLALNPFVSGIGNLFPQLLSAGAIVAVVLSLPTIGPMLLEATVSEDTTLAGSLLMILSLLGIMGTLISDLLLLWLDPRIRMEGCGK